jgi:predicted TIM-barrel fold metal-dependent hydrolase
MAPISVIDPHFHLWDLERNFYPWLMQRPLPASVAGDVSPIAQSYSLEQYLAETTRWRVIACVHVDAGFDPADPVAETRWLQEIASVQGFPQGIVAAAQLHDPGVEAVLAGHAAFPNVRGIRHIVNWHEDPGKTYVARPDLLVDPRWNAGFALLRRYGLSFDLQLYPSQMAEAAALAARHPDTLLILNHAGMPVDRHAAGLAEWRAGIRLLAAEPNVAVKISGLGMMDWAWTVDSLRPFVLETIAAFGTDRCMFASNFPVDRLYSSFDRLFDAFDEIVTEFSADERRALFAETARRLYRLT